MNPSRETGFAECLLDELSVDDEASFRHVALYADLKQVLRDAGYRFRVLPPIYEGRWDRAQLLNLSFWGADSGGDVLVDRHLPADVVAHVAWHHLAHRATSEAAASATNDGTRTVEGPAASALFLGEAIASAFDLYLVGRLLGHAPESSFLETQVPAMAEAADVAGLSAEEFEELLESVAADPERAFADLRELLMDATSALFACDSVDGALAALARFDEHRFASLLHHYELSNWVLYARAYAAPSPQGEARVAAIEGELRAAPVALDWLVREWVCPKGTTRS